MKAVLDTNVVVSGIFFGGVPGEVLEAWAETRFELCLSPLIIDEYLRTCDRLASLRRTLAHQEVLAALLAHGSLVADDITRGPVTADPDDDKFMICARKAGAMVVSGDRGPSRRFRVAGSAGAHSSRLPGTAARGPRDSRGHLTTCVSTAPRMIRTRSASCQASALAPAAYRAVRTPG